MAHWLPTSSFISRNLSKQPSCKYTADSRCGKVRFSADLGNLRIESHGRKIIEQKMRRRPWLAQCCTSSSSASTTGKELGLVGKAEELERCENKEEESEYLASKFGWKVRRLIEEDDEMRRVAQIQAEAFHVPMALFDDLFFEFFKAEVLYGLTYKLRNSPPDRYACLVAEPTSDASESHRKLVGVVDVTVLRDKAVLQHLRGAEEYLYVSGLAVSKIFRRRKVASVLLKACDMLSILWGFEYLVLRAYEDDTGARKLYTNAGYQVVSGDPQWMTNWIGRRRRIVMIKQTISHH